MAGGFDEIKPPGFIWAITPDDDADLKIPTRGIFVGTGGNVTGHAYSPITNKIAPVTLKNVAGGTTLVGVFTRILSTGTTAADMVALA